MTSAPAIAVMRDGSRIPLSDPLDEARRRFRDGEYDMDEVKGIELSEGATDLHPVAINWPSATVQLALL